MAELLTIARPYAEAAFKIARDGSALPSWSDALARLATVASTPVARDLVGNPKIAAAQVAALIADSAGSLNAEQRNFVTLLASNERLGVVAEIAAQFETLRNAHEGIVDASISSAFPLSDEQLADIVGLLRAKHGSQVKASVTVDPELIGGVSIRIGDEVMDASVRGSIRLRSASFSRARSKILRCPQTPEIRAPWCPLPTASAASTACPM
ncbi:MAG: F0F1 ATP synthase subunit delta [Quisquiliibacterium sp.]